MKHKKTKRNRRRRSYRRKRIYGGTQSKTSIINPSAYPNPGPIPKGDIFLNTTGALSGGCGGVGGTCPLFKGGGSNSFVGQPWQPPIKDWPGVDGISGNRNHYDLNTYNTDVSRQMIDLGSNAPFVGAPFVGGRKNRTRKHQSYNQYIRNKKKELKQSGGANMSNFLAQDLVNLGRQFQYGVGSTYNAMIGQPAPVNPLPWKDQFQHTNSIKALI